MVSRVHNVLKVDLELTYLDDHFIFALFINYESLLVERLS